MILSFELTMPNVGSWNGKWTGDQNKYYRHRKVSKKEVEKLLSGKPRNSFHYNFGDGWCANVSVEVVSSSDKNKRERISKGFYGYDWMIGEILEHGRILTKQERIPKKEFIGTTPIITII